jgi:polyisoprenoid-binding protein YceI
MRLDPKNLLIFSALALFSWACGGVEGETVDSGDAVETSTDMAATATVFTVDPATTQIMWEGSKLIGGTNHQGTLAVQGGSIQVLEGNVTGGEIIIDMTSLANLDLEAGNGKEKLEGHLKSGDFFDVEQHPTATFAIAGAEPVSGEAGITHRLTGNLTIKNQTRSVTIPAKVAIENGTLTATTPQFVIDRTEWGVKYGSGSLAGIAQDNIINDDVGLKLAVTATAPAN